MTNRENAGALSPGQRNNTTVSQSFAARECQCAALTHGAPCQPKALLVAVAASARAGRRGGGAAGGPGLRSTLGRVAR